MPRGIKITSLHGLKSAGQYDYAHNIAECTHYYFRFVEYVDGNPGREWSGVVKNEQLWNLLLEAGCIAEEGER